MIRPIRISQMVVGVSVVTIVHLEIPGEVRKASKEQGSGHTKKIIIELCSFFLFKRIITKELCKEMVTEADMNIDTSKDICGGGIVKKPR